MLSYLVLKKGLTSIMNVRQHISILFRLSRLREYFLHLFLIPLLILLISPQNFLSFKTIIIYLANLFLTAFTYAINDVEDAEDDYQDFKKRNRNIISNGMISKKWGYVITFSFLFIGLILLFLLNRLVFAVGLLLSVNSFFYSWKKLRLKSIPILDLVSHATCLGVLQFLTTYLTFNPLDSQIIPFLIMIIPFSASCQISQQLRDFKIDKKTKINNTSQLIGKKISMALIYYLCIIFTIGFVAIDLNKFIVLSPFALLSSLFYFRLRHHLPLSPFPYLKK